MKIKLKTDYSRLWDIKTFHLYSLIAYILSGCIKLLSEEDKAKTKVAALNIGLTQVNDDIKATTENDKQYSDGLIK